MLREQVEKYLEERDFQFIDCGVWNIKGWKGASFGIRVTFERDNQRVVHLAPVSHTDESCPGLEFNGFTEVSGNLKLYLDQLIFICQQSRGIGQDYPYNRVQSLV